MTSGRVLVAGVGNIFCSDDGFGVEVIRQLAATPMPPWVQVVDFGIRGVHLAYDLLDGCELLVLVDAAERGEAPGTVSVIEVALPNAADLPDGVPVMDAHSLAPEAVLTLLARLGGRVGRTLLVACEPADTTPGIGLSEPVRAATPHAVRAVQEIVGALRPAT
jgi:hydrogenase maturation protease